MKKTMLLIPLILPLYAKASSLEDTNTYVKLVGSWRCVAPNGAISVKKYTAIGEFESDSGGSSQYVGKATVEDGVLLTEFSSPGSSFVSKMAQYIEFADWGKTLKTSSVYGNAECQKIE